VTNEKLAELKALCEKATSGPWTISEVQGNSMNEFQVDQAIDDHWEKNAAFIAAARTAMPELIVEVERLWEENEKIKQDPSAVTAWKLLLIEDENKSLNTQLNEARKTLNEIYDNIGCKYPCSEKESKSCENRCDIGYIARAWLEKNK